MKEKSLSENIFIAMDLGARKISAIAAKISEGKLQILGVEREIMPSGAIINGLIQHEEVVKKKIIDLLNLLNNRIKKFLPKNHAISTFRVAVNGIGIHGREVTISRNVSHIDRLTSQEMLAMRAKLEKALTQKIKSLPTSASGLARMFTLRESGVEIDGEWFESCEELELGGAQELTCYYTLMYGGERLLANCGAWGQYTSEGAIGLDILGKALLDEEQREKGCCLLELGASGTTFVVYKDSKFRAGGYVGVGGEDVTRDICYLNVSEANAEKLKSMCSAVEALEGERVMSIHNVKVAFKDASKIIEARESEIFEIIKKEIEKYTSITELEGGIILTGGASKQKDIDILAGKIFELDARVLNLNDFTSSGEDIDASEAMNIALLLTSNQTCIKKEERKKINIFKKAKDTLDKGVNAIPGMFD